MKSDDKKKTSTKKVSTTKTTKKVTAKAKAKKVVDPVKVKRVEKKGVISKHAKHQKDTGSVQVQIAILSARIEYLTEHLKEHNKDNHSRRGLLLMVGKRRKLLNYLKNSQPEKYTEVIESLKLRK